MTLRLGDIVAALAGEFDARLVGDPDVLVERLAPLESASAAELTFLSHPKYQGKLARSAAACVVVGPGAAAAAMQRGACIIVDDPYFYFARITQLWKREHAPSSASGGTALHPSAFIDPQARLAAGVVVGAFACIGARAVLDAGVQVGAHSVIGNDAHIGAETRLSARVTVADGCSLGERCIVHPGAVIGADGFGFAPHAGRWEKIEQLGAVRIGNDVEIGANTCIDRGALQDTVIEDGVKLDNLVQIGHNVRVGAHTAMAGCAGVAGSATIGAHCTVGGGAVVLGHLSLADHVHISAASVVTRSIHKPGHYTGLFPIDDNAQWEKNAATLKQLHALRERLKMLEQTTDKASGKTEEKS
ncbi:MULTISPECIES: UDP-3-O-(3-hydroxymyristoyl)glucosamine N-acyltransferase [unclassified Polaromonas]|uniref:UDP-3-O-(3-hydroxymyristoyl)glucosamine N-acyltransferase n=1 Tax=unclassified Polaromonas TaxID=2638319 RepID=UPI000BCCB7BE|nr:MULTISPECIES: UDP-3-O-(3-hydroxymyristoyl)glucosamine N-acyltransferase [unclassified Polaromonas]OYY39085.1 MAG: UDP-3-O-(3-hydroxymyristoyl)glucosamine N-acyltransferase [Polaromonas sp. 35-63-35]OYZ21950.1 MAG: UDP-3-O-(3-hydroxymyristoyl)glucosamine N-acyltransferase [Polaromonas sp. 16-63-31]OYZ80387.1 MAG: UDP-3-O-(3-hydroxymyristoyl)glucosamine N-acyltransferase [Polaromonas sp. 24-63-21]OZA51451.1 MAG: UDP-3-O-(3-hydroxymyristoyl)glucosamine N-acyltransferase [Polaromonas sp. 17-63-3